MTTGISGSQANNLRFVFLVLCGELISLSLLQTNTACWGGEQVPELFNETDFWRRLAWNFLIVARDLLHWFAGSTDPCLLLHLTRSWLITVPAKEPVHLVAREVADGEPVHEAF